MEEMVILNAKDVYEYLRDLFTSLKCKRFDCNLDVYHHNTDYEKMESIILHGIQPLAGLNSLKIKSFTPEQLRTFDDITSHINGNDGISLSKVDQDGAYSWENIFDPYSCNSVDIIIDGIRAHRITTHYFNEFIHDGSIMPDKFIAFDIRILKLIDTVRNKEDLKKIETIVQCVEALRAMVMAMRKRGLNIPVREMSHEDSHESGPSLDSGKIIEMPKINIRK